MANLNQKQIEKMLRSAFSEAVPDKADRIVKAAAKDNRAPTYSIMQEDLKQKYLKRAGLIAAALVVVFSIVFILILTRSHTPYASITVESDERIEIAVNRDCRPLSINGFGSSAIRLARQVDKCDSISEAIDGVLDAMLKNGNLGDTGNTVLITVDAPENEEELLETAFTAARESFEKSGFNGAILTAVASEDADINRVADRHRISVGKAEMITDIRRADRSLGSESLSRLSVNDLNLLSENRRIRYLNIDVFGESRGCITPKSAMMNALGDLGVTDNNATAALGVDGHGLVYRVIVHSSDGVYIYRLDAISGEILAVSKGDTPQTAMMADKNTPSPSPDDMSAEKPTAKATENSRTPQSNQTITHTSPSPSPTNSSPPRPAATERTVPKPAATEASPPTAAPQPATKAPEPTEPPRREPAIFTASTYQANTAGVLNGSPLTSSAKQISLTRIVNGYDIYYDHSDFPYTPVGQQGGISAIVCNREQFYRLTGTYDSRFDADYFEDHVLYIHMNRDVDYHWIKSIRAAYMDGSALCLYNSEPIGYHIAADSGEPARIYTVIYELDKSDLTDLVNIIEYTD